jgi:DNA-binding transcriptional ArsR family regulator
MNPLKLSDEAMELVAQRFRCMGEATRLKILRSLESGEKSVGELTRELNAPQANISKHLKMLVEARSENAGGSSVVGAQAGGDLCLLFNH